MTPRAELRDRLRRIEHPSLGYLRECFDLDAESGVLTWRTRPRHHFVSLRGFRTWNATHAGKQAGIPTVNGYLRTAVCKVRYQVHRIIFAMHHSMELRDVPALLDHINGCRSDNRPANLRPANALQNSHNVRLRPQNTSGFRGVQQNKRSGRWLAAINIAGVRTHLGTFDTPEEASAAYEAEARRIHGAFYNPDANALQAGAV